MTEKTITIGDVSARLIKLMMTLGATNDHAFNGAMIAELQRANRLPLPAAFEELLGTLEQLGQAVNHDRESLRRERDAYASQCRQWDDHSQGLLAQNAQLVEICKRQGQLIDEMSD